MSFSKWAAIAAALVTSAYGGTIISNTAAAPLGPLGGVDFTGTAQVGTQFTMGATAYDNVSFILGILAIGNRALGPEDVVLNIFTGNSTAPSGASLLTLTHSGNFSGNQADLYTYTAPSNFTLGANTTYWIVANSTINNQEGWLTFGNTVVNRQPTGPGATAPLGFNRNDPGPPVSLQSSTDAVVYEVDGTAVTSGPPPSGTPEPSTVAMISVAAAALGFRKLSHRRGSEQSSR